MFSGCCRPIRSPFLGISQMSRSIFNPSWQTPSARSTIWRGFGHAKIPSVPALLYQQGSRSACEKKIKTCALRCPKNLRDYWTIAAIGFAISKTIGNSLAHRVPLYVVPYIVSLENGPEYDRLGRLIEIAATGDDHEGYTALRYSQSQLMEFKPVMIHSIDEAVGHIPFHRQMLDDFFTLETIAMKMLEDMQSKLTSGAWRS